MAATGSTDKDRHLAQPPGDFRSALPGRRRLRPSIWVAAALLVVALSFLVLPVARGSAQTATLAEPATLAAAAESPAPVVPILFPLEQRISWTDTFGAARSGGRTHAGNDLMAPKMTPLLAVVDGTVDWLNLTGELSSYNSFPYYNILLRGDDGNDYFYIHLNNDTPGTDDGLGGTEYAYAPGLINGTHVHRGDLIGYVGDSGNAEDTAPHLHFEIHLGGYVSASAGQTRSAPPPPHAQLHRSIRQSQSRAHPGRVDRGRQAAADHDDHRAGRHHHHGARCHYHDRGAETDHDHHYDGAETDYDDHPRGAATRDHNDHRG
jgi:murein DD-endopeptidase MepM/ murein hydrolase activator NlpD